MSPSQNIIKLLVGVIAISFSAIFVKWADVNPTISAFFRTFYATLLLSALAFSKPSVNFKNPSRLWISLSILAGIFLGIDLIVWHKAILYIGAGPSTLLGNSQIIFVTIMVYFFFKEKIHPMFWIMLPLIFAGLFLAIPKTNILVEPGKGFFMGMIVGLTYAGFLMGMRYAHRLTPKPFPEFASLGLIMLTSALIIGPYALFVEKLDLLHISFHSHVMMFLMALVAQCFGWIFIQGSITKLPGHQGSLLLLLQPILTTLWGVLFFTEPFSKTQFFGIVLAIGCIALYQIRFAPAHTPEIDSEPS